MTKQRQAVVIIHGIGEQRPMDTLRSFVIGMLGASSRNGKRLFYSKPDPNADTFELRRYRAFDFQADTDFVEFYWQHRMPIAGWRFLFSWLWRLMNRPAASMPPRFVALWWIAWSVFTITGVLVGLSILEWFGVSRASLGPKLEMSWGIALVAGALGFLVRAFVGDAAIYLNAHPRTVEARNQIRTAGVELLERLQNDGRYDRIIVVGHSLGSIIGYDILSFAWHRSSEAFRQTVEAGRLPTDSPKQSGLRAAQLLAKPGAKNVPDKWQGAVRALNDEMKALGMRWIVSDFVTVGSPLAHASLLMALGPDDLKRRQQERELPTSPPYCENGLHFSYRREGTSSSGNRQSARVPDHAALFGLTAWTNLYFPCRAFFFGDLVGGAVSPVFGPGVRDVVVTTRIWGGWLSHTRYWTRYPSLQKDPANAPLQLLRALDLTRSSFPGLPASPPRKKGKIAKKAQPKVPRRQKPPRLS